MNNDMNDPPADQSTADKQQNDGDSAADSLIPVVEAILFATDKPLPASKIAGIAGIRGQADVNRTVERLNRKYADTGAAFHIKTIAGGYQMQTLPEYDDVLSRLHHDRKEHRLSHAAMETLAIIAYRQPILRADIEAIRGVACGEVLRGLMEKQLIKIAARAEVLGRPILYGTTRRFLEVFGLADLNDLPNVEELRQPAAVGEQTVVAGEESQTDDQTAPQNSEEAQ